MKSAKIYLLRHGFRIYDDYAKDRDEFVHPGNTDGLYVTFNKAAFLWAEKNYSLLAIGNAEVSATWIGSYSMKPKLTKAIRERHSVVLLYSTNPLFNNPSAICFASESASQRVYLY